MKKYLLISAVLLLIGYTVAAPGEVVIRQEPLTWQQVGQLEGDELYNNLCAACHGADGAGNGAAASVMEKHVPDLTVIAARNSGVFSHKAVEDVIYGESRVVAHNTIDMPAWGEQFMYLRPGWNSILRENYARNRVHALTTHIERLQVE